MTRLDNRNQRLGTALVLGGLVLLLFRFFSWAVGWPLIILGPGLALFLAAALGGRAVSALFVPGSVVTTLGSIVLMQNATIYFES